jgi:hypothetical protein
VRFGGLENEIDHKELLALAVEVMKAALNDCNLHEVKREALSPPRQELATRQATRQELVPTKLVPATSVRPNLLKRPASSTLLPLEGVATNKRA